MKRLNRYITTWIVAACMMLVASATSKAQDVGIKSNIVSDVALSPNVGVEVGLAPKWTLDVSAQGNFWTIDQRRWKHAFVQPEIRYWFCERFAGHFVGAHLIGGAYNFGKLNLANFLGSDLSRLKDTRYQGWAAGAGIVYGYAWPLHKHWNVEAVVGVGWMYTRYDSYPCAECGTKLEENRVHNYVGPTKLGVNIQYIF